MVTKQRNQVVGFLKAKLRAYADNARDASYAAKLAVEKYGGDLGLDLKQQVTLNRLQVPLELEAGTNIPFWFSDQSIRNMCAIARVTGRENLPPPERLIDQSMLEEAYRALGGKA